MRTPDMRNSFRYVIFLLALGLLSLCYDYPDVLLKRPQSVHNWRQCDGASLALSYYQNGMHFFQPQTQGLYSDNFTTGYTAPSEIPVLYYFVALLYSIFGYHEVIFRAVNLLLFFLGLFYLFRLGLEATRSVFYSLALVVIIFSAPVLVYYGNNYLPNTVALSFSLIGWYYFYRYYKSEKTKTFMLSVLFFGIAGAMKVTELTGPIIVLGMLLLERFGIFRTGVHAHRHLIPKLAALAMIFAMVGGWILYARSYNNLHGTAQFSTFIFPYWELDQEAVAFVFHKMRVLWFSDYFYPPTFFLLLTGLILTALLWKRADRMLSFSSLALLTAILGFSLLWFAALGDHDYFFIGF
jgi:4-amino-4-deoxy-L-arabinose transferase-like glycosyltransferase